MPSLVDHFRPNVHDAAITAAAYDPQSGTTATADSTGRVAVQRPREATPQLIFHPGGPVQGALSLCRGGQLVAVGDEDGTIGVYRTLDGEPVFREVREGSRGRVRAMRGVAISSASEIPVSVSTKPRPIRSLHSAAISVTTEAKIALTTHGVVVTSKRSASSAWNSPH